MITTDSDTAADNMSQYHGEPEICPDCCPSVSVNCLYIYCKYIKLMFCTLDRY